MRIAGVPELRGQKLKLMLAPPAWRLLRATLAVQTLSSEIPLDDGPVIFACLHRDIIASILYVGPAHPSLLVSNSDDGLILVRTLGDKEYDFIRGATGENGGRALVHLRRALREGHSIGLAVDGPKGPFGAIHPGVFQLARLSGAPVVPLLPTVKPSVVLGTWDRTVVPLFFSRIKMKMGPLMRVPADAGEADFQELHRRLFDFFQPGKAE